MIGIFLELMKNCISWRGLFIRRSGLFISRRRINNPLRRINVSPCATTISSAIKINYSLFAPKFFYIDLF